MTPFYEVFGSENGSGLVILSDDPVDFHPAGKTVNVVCVPSLDDALEYVNVATQTVGIYPPSRAAGLRDLLSARGMQRIVPLGEVIDVVPGVPTTDSSRSTASCGGSSTTADGRRIRSIRIPFAATRRCVSCEPKVPSFRLPGSTASSPRCSYDAVEAGLRKVEDFGGSAAAGRHPRGGSEHRGDPRATPRQDPPHHQLGRGVPQEPADRAVPPATDAAACSTGCWNEAERAGADGVDAWSGILRTPSRPWRWPACSASPRRTRSRTTEWATRGGRRFQEAAATGASVAIGGREPRVPRRTSTRGSRSDWRCRGTSGRRTRSRASS